MAKIISLKKKDKAPSQVKFIQTLQPAPALSKEQDMLGELFGGNDSWGTGQNLPEIRGELRSGGGLINCGDEEGETASMFGFVGNKRFGFAGGY